MKFEPIAIIGNACLFPGALTPQALWELSLEGRDVLSKVPDGYWRVDPEHVRAASPHKTHPDTPDPTRDRTWCDRGGYVKGFESVFDPNGFSIRAVEILEFDPLVHWLLHTGRQALEHAGYPDVQNMNTGAVFGNLSYPSHSLNHFSESIWLQAQNPALPVSAAGEQVLRCRPHAVNRFMSGLPAHILARALNLKAGAFALDAACASSLYAIKLACDQLHDRKADLMLAGGVNRADDLILHVGFCALQAMSRSSRSRPYHRRADGLVPSQGAGFVVLKRLDDAERADDRILGVIRGIGLSNDGGSQGMLVPSVEGQTRAIRQAYHMSGLNPGDISLVEGHATGTLIGDRVEILSMARIYQGLHDIPIGSIKSNMGHPITASGMAGLIKVLGAIRASIRPPTLHAQDPIEELANSPFRLLTQPEAWDGPSPRRAVVNNFGFGGNNAHLIVEEWTPGVGHKKRSQSAAAQSDIAIVGIGGVVASADGMAEFANTLFSGKSGLARQDDGNFSGRAEPFQLPLLGLRFSPADLDQTLPQQLLLLKAALEATAEAGPLASNRTAVIVGMGCDAEAARSGMCWRLPGWVDHWARQAGDANAELWLSNARDRIRPIRQAGAIIGAMPNITANRINSQFDLTGPGYTISAEELSGIHSLDLAIRSLTANEIDTALVGAVDLCCEPVHAAAAASVLNNDRQTPGDAAVMLVLKRVEDARKDGNKIYARLSDAARPEPTLQLGLAPEHLSLTPRFGHAHAASGLVHVVAAALACHHNTLPTSQEEKGSARPWRVSKRPISAVVSVHALGGESASIHLKSDMQGHKAPETRAEVPQEPMATRTYASHPPNIELPPVIQDTKQHGIKKKPWEDNTIRNAILAQHAGVTSVHAHFLAQQTKAHQYFLAGRIEALDLLMRFGSDTHTSPGAEDTDTAPHTVVFGNVNNTLPTAPEDPSDGNGDWAGPPQKPKGPTFSYDQLEVFASGNISDVFGPLFEKQDNYRRRVRLPEPPLLLTHRVTGIDAHPGTMGKGVIWTETDVEEDAWYIHDGCMSPGMAVEAGQSDLLLISWLGIDFLNHGERVYRLLGCDLVYHGAPAKAGDTLCYEIHVDGYSQAGGVRIFFFHYDCRIDGELFLSVRNAQAGFFTDQELATSSGIIWRPETAPADNAARLDPPAVACTRSRFTQEQIKAFSQGRVHDCFGPGFEITQTHIKTPKIPAGRMRLLDRVTHFNPGAGPWKRGYLRVENRIPSDAWYLLCHFKDDPCMPGTLMSDACLQAMAVYLTALGHTLNRDGWRFEPVPDQMFHIKCRGQVTPDSRQLSYDIFVEEIIAGPHPTIFADLLGVCDGLKILHIRRMGLRLVPDWPLEGRPDLLENHVEQRTVARAAGIEFGFKSLLACAFGRPSDAFGELGRPFDNGRHICRLPGPPYHFVTRVSRIEAQMGAMKTGETVEIEYDIPGDAWYFESNGHPTMPLCVLMEAALQPCGWLSVFEGVPLTSEEALYIRNLDGTATMTKEVDPHSGRLTTRTTLTNISRIKGITLVNFAVTCFEEDKAVYQMDTGFGFFLKGALDQQVGLPATIQEKAWLDAPCDFRVDLTQRPDKYFGQTARLPEPMLLMLDRVTGYWPGSAGQTARLRAEKSVHMQEWFFKAHFFQDPVQPGSLGVEAMVQLLQFYMLHENLHQGMIRPRFRPLSLDAAITWKYRGQVTPDNKRITVEMTILTQDRDADGAYAVAEAWLWADDLRIFHVRGLKIHMIEEDGVSTRRVSHRNAAVPPNVHPDQTRRKLAQLLHVQPSTICLTDAGQTGVCDSMPLNLFPFTTARKPDGRLNLKLGEPSMDYKTIFTYARHQLGIRSWFGEDYFKALIRLFTRHLVVEDPRAFKKILGRSTLFLGNHQVQIESIIFPTLAQVISGPPILAIANANHRNGWLGPVDDMISSYPGITTGSHVIYFDQKDHKSMFGILERLGSEIENKGVSVFLHAEGKLGRTCRHPVQNLSSVFVDLALASNLPVVPVRFCGGLPIAAMDHTLDFPIGYGRQDYHIGRPIMPDELRALPYAQRRKMIMDRINGLGPAVDKETPLPPNPDFASNVAAWKKKTGASEEQAVLFKALEMLPGTKTQDTRALILAAYSDLTGIENSPNASWLYKMADWLVGGQARVKKPGEIAGQDCHTRTCW